MSTWLNFTLQNSNSPLMEQLIFFHDHSMMILIIITIFISYLMLILFKNKFINRFYLSNQMIEVIWTILPSIILLFIALPSIHILYLLDEIKFPFISIKSIGHQWYWSYEYQINNKNISFDSYMLNEKNNFRLLKVDNNTIIPINMQIRMLITATDVLHSWTIPSLGVKVDAVPGRLNQISFLINRMGLYFGQCSEICGANHSFMPIVIESTNFNFFKKWILSN